MGKFRQFIGVFVTIFVVLTFTAPLYAGLDDKSLVLYLSFDEGKGGNAADGSVHGHDGELIEDPAWVDGQFGKALEFDGTKQQYVIVPINDTLQLREEFSVAFWVKRDKAQIRDWNYMVAAGSLKWATIFQNASSNTFFWSTSGGAWAQKAVSDDIQPEDWVHLAVTHDTGSKVTIYNDGKVAGGGAKPPPVDEIDGSIMVGARHPGQEFFTGIIDEVFLFNRIITDAEISDIMNGDFLPVEPAEKLTTTWGSIKADRD
ncbi:MAG: LamG domain-containing protein [Candidatus Poribacteria bacterium]|nr:LamG domain-containing protein [Candidatus Poribacteria bacterium]MYK17371.1 LamG domain-containing protein [Candidatus Poribacteria bacterium]